MKLFNLLCPLTNDNFCSDKSKRLGSTVSSFFCNKLNYLIWRVWFTQFKLKRVYYVPKLEFRTDHRHILF